MTEDKKAFQKIFRSLVIAFPSRRLERDASDVYWAVLGGLPIAVLRESALALARSSKFFPSTGEWFQAAEEVRLAERRALAARPAVGPIVCPNCSDTGWVYVTQAGKSFVTACACRSTNQAYQRNRIDDVLRGVPPQE
jgi:hypothetical protein